MRGYTVLQDYITVKEKGSVFLPHTAGRYSAKRFRKAHVSSYLENVVCSRQL